MPARVLLILVLACFLPVRASAWHYDGHMAIARIAWKQLSDKEKTQIARMLKSHPHFELYLCAERPPNLDLSEIEWAFARAATWPDWVRDPRVRDPQKLDEAKSKAIAKEFDNTPGHFVNLPYVHPAEAGSFDVAELRKAVLFPEFDARTHKPRHAIAALKQSMRLLRSRDATEENKAIQLCWLLHVVGDIHQPLHAVTLIARTQFAPQQFNPPLGDEGGNRLAVRIGETATRLHTFWDALVFNDDPMFANVDAKAVELLKNPKYERDQLPDLADRTFLKWAEESYLLARTIAYKEDGDPERAFLKATPLAKNASLVGLDAPVLSAKYQKSATQAAERRIVLAGYRLAYQLKLVLHPLD